jgi:hypothetical protein
VQQLIVPSAMKASVGMTAGARPKTSARTKDNVGERQYLVIEFDFKLSDEASSNGGLGDALHRLIDDGFTVADVCAALHQHLAKQRRLALVVHSGGKSLHGWFPCHGESDSQLRPFMDYAASLGADTMTYTPCQFVRLPGGLRRDPDGKERACRQRILYFNPKAVEVIR